MLEEQAVLDFYGLSSNPFSSEICRKVFCGFGKRHQTLEQILHLNQFSHLTILILAPHGFGKTSLFNQLKSQLNSLDTLKVAAFKGKPELSAVKLLTDLASSWGMAATSDTVEELLRQLRKYNLAQSALGNRHVIAIDDADCLGADVLEALQELRAGLPEEQSIGLTLFAQEGLVEFRDYFRPASDLHIIHLPALNSRETMQLLQEYFSHAGLKKGVPFSTDEIEKLYLASEGVPGEIKRVTLAYMQEQANSSGTTQNKLPWLHVAAVGLIVVTVVGSFLYQNQTQLSDTQRTNQVQIPIESSVAERLAEAAAKVEQRQAQISIEEDGIASAKLDLEITSEPDEKPDERVQLESTEQKAEAATQTENKLAETQDSKTVEVPATATATPNENKTAAKPQIKPWYETAPSNEFTVQLFGTHQKETAQTFIQNLQTPDTTSVYETMHNNKDWYVVIMGQYPSKEAAQSAVSKLSLKPSDGQPWIRSFQSIRDSL